MHTNPSPQPPLLPLPLGRRRAYFGTLLLIFIIAVPFLFLYATGYRFEGMLGLVKTGGIYVGAERADAEIYIEGVLVRETGTFRRAFFVQNLEPGVYTLEVRKEGYHSWGKTLPVFAHIVTEAQAFTMPTEPELTVIPRLIESQTTTTAPIENPLHIELLAQFASETATSTIEGDIAVATTTKAFQGMLLFDAGEHIVARWTRSTESIPFYFCTPGHACTDEIVLNTKGAHPSYFDFFPGTAHLVIVTLPDGVYVTELDNRSGQNIQPIWEGRGADFRVFDGNVYILAEGVIYEAGLFEDR